MWRLDFVLCALIGGLFTLPGAALASCEADTDCKGSRICQAGACVEPPAASTLAPQPLPAPAAQPQQAAGTAPVYVAPPAAPAPQHSTEPTRHSESGGRRPLKTTPGTLMLSGQLSFSTDVTVSKGSASIDSKTKTGNYLTVAPGLGVFVAPHFALETSFDFGIGFGDTHNSSDWRGSFAFGFGIYPNLGSFGALYVRALAGPTFVVGENVPTQKYLDFSIPVGLLIAVHEHVAIDIGLRFNASYRFSQNSDAPSTTAFDLNVPVGYFGVKAFL